MKLNSNKEFIELLEGLQVLGFVIPFCDYEQQMKQAGLVKHIHNYDCKIKIIQVEHIHKPIISIVFKSKDKSYELILRKEQ